MKKIDSEEFVRDQIQGLLDNNVDGIAFWTGLKYWVRIATSNEDYGTPQQEARNAFTKDYFDGTEPNWQGNI